MSLRREPAQKDIANVDHERLAHVLQLGRALAAHDIYDGSATSTTPIGGRHTTVHELKKLTASDLSGTLDDIEYDTEPPYEVLTPSWYLASPHEMSAVRTQRGRTRTGAIAYLGYRDAPFMPYNAMFSIPASFQNDGADKSARDVVSIRLTPPTDDHGWPVVHEWTSTTSNVLPSYRDVIGANSMSNPDKGPSLVRSFTVADVGMDPYNQRPLHIYWWWCTFHVDDMALCDIHPDIKDTEKFRALASALMSHEKILFATQKMPVICGMMIEDVTSGCVAFGTSSFFVDQVPEKMSPEIGPPRNLPKTPYHPLRTAPLEEAQRLLLTCPYFGVFGSDAMVGGSAFEAAEADFEQKRTERMTLPYA